jgi:hypothetical protein
VTIGILATEPTNEITIDKMESEKSARIELRLAFFLSFLDGVVPGFA